MMNLFIIRSNAKHSSFNIHHSSFIINKMPDLFDFFKENESKLHERPSDEVWQKLEKKLEKSRRPKRRGIQFMQLSVVVLMLLLLTLAAVMVWYFSKK